jgi:hypothetical protein
MRLCEYCHSYSSDDRRCSNCGYRFVARQAVNSTTTTQILGQPPDNRRQRKYSTLIPGFGAFGLLRRDSLTGQWGCAPGCLITTILAVIFALGGYLFLNHKAYLSVSNIVPSGLMRVKGTNFPPDTTVDITVDGSPVAVHSTNIFTSIGGIMLWGRQTRPVDHIVAVASNGTFETMVPVPSS